MAAVVFIVAAATDILDGYIARSRKQISNLGKIIDPLADKLLISAALISLVELNLVKAWLLLLLFQRICSNWFKNSCCSRRACYSNKPFG